jgi:acyl dehydratase
VTQEIQPATTQPVTRERVAAYGDAVGDHNPVHFDPGFAATAGLPDTVVHGPLTTAIVIDCLVAQLGADQLLNVDVRLRGPVFPGDALTLTPVRWGQEDRGLEVHNQSGDLIATVIIVLEGDPDAS